MKKVILAVSLIAGLVCFNAVASASVSKTAEVSLAAALKQIQVDVQQSGITEATFTASCSTNSACQDLATQLKNAGFDANTVGKQLSVDLP